MNSRSAFVTKAMFAFLCLYGSLYCLLAYVPFTAQQFIKSEVLPILNQSARVQPFLYWLLLALAAPAIGFRKTALNIGFWIVHISAGILFAVHPILAHVESTGSGLIWALILLIPVLWLAAMDWIDGLARIRWKPVLADQARAVFHGSWQAGLFAAIAWGGLALARHPRGEWTTGAGTLGFAATLFTHELIFFIFFVTLNLLGVISTWFETPPLAQFVLCHLLGGTLLYLLFRIVVFPGLSFNGGESVAYSAGFALAATAYLSSQTLQFAARADEGASSGLSIALGFRQQMKPAGLRTVAIVVALMLGAAIFGSVTISKNDWNFLIQKVMVLVIWILAFRLFFSYGSRGTFRPSSAGWLLTCALLVLPSFRIWEATRNLAWRATGGKETLNHFLDQWSGYDVSLKTIRDLMTMDTNDEGFYRYLTKNTNIPRSVNVAPAPVNLVDNLDYTPGKKPNIFVIVVDSLRRDYLSPYNAAVNFTPRIGQFAQESTVMDNAFTHYGATGLSEPSIWVGGMLLHKQYVTPFAPMNALQKLLEKEKYKALISRDTILQVIVPEWPALEEIDRGRANMDYDLCTSLEELGTRVASEPKDARLFAYTQPQNIHISVINRAGAKAISDANYGAFYPPYASRLQRMDGCFGSFIDKLKALGIYDSSIVILTADHGDSLGEQGRWGHAYSVYPEIVRIPMLIHLPPDLQRGLYVNPKGLAFSTDITPTLYYLTGHKPANRGEMFGMPLYVESSAEQTSFRHANYLIASSYGAVYGILSGDGRDFSVFDAVNYKSYGFDLSSWLGGQTSLNPTASTNVQKLIRQRVDQIDDFYHFRPAGEPQ